MKEPYMIKKAVIGAICSILLIIIDQLTKLAAITHLKDQAPISLIDGVFELRYLENKGAAFGMLQNQRLYFIITTSVVVIALVYIFLRRIPRERRFFWLDMIAVLFLSGAIGNLIDRVRFGYVVDFFYFILIDFPIFNVADIYVTVGALLLIVLFLFYYKEADFERIFPDKKSKKEKKSQE